MNSSSKKLKVFIIDDDLAIRQCLKILLTSLYGDKFDIYSSGDGVEGLGMLYILNPDLIIIDTTLPTYSGRELIDYVTSNGRFTNTKLIVVDDRGNLVPGLNPNIKILSKQNPNFVKDLESNVREALGPGETKRGVIGKIKNFLIRKTLSWANRSDLVMFNISKHRKGGIFSFLKTFILFPFWFIAQIITSLGLAFLYLFTSGKIKDANIPQAVSDNKAFRVLAYPTLIGVLTAAVFFIIQIALFIGGGIVIFNSVRLESIFANNGGEVSLNFNTATYDSDLIVLVEGRLRLKEQFTSVEVEDAPAEFTEEPTLDETVLNQPESETPTETQPEVIEPSEPLNQEGETEVVQPVENTGEESNGEVQGINDESDVVGVSAENVSVGYSITNPVITFNESIEFSNLVRIEESSSINTIAESTPDINSQDSKRKDVSIEALRDRIFPSNTVTYQLSPNNLDWYYFNANNIVENNVNAGWEKTEQGFVSSNTVQEVNQYLSNYLEVVGGNTLYLRIYLHSDGATQVSLNEIKVIREQSIITLLNEEVPNESDIEEDVASLPITFPTDEEEIVETVIPELPIPTIFQATYANGNKVVYGKLLGASIPDSELQYIKVNVYYTSSTDITKTAEDKLELIGESSLSRNETGDLTFLLITPNRAGGYVTAELVYVINNVEVTSILSKPLENSTFTVDSTADTADHTLNGICSVGTATGGACTLRAAIAEANNVAGADNIYFNIPTSDSGYRDYDTPDSPSSGDGVGGDDYWTIRPASVLPTILETATIDGSTQTSNQQDSNSLGPEIEINGQLQAIRGLFISGAGASGSSVSGIAILKFNSTNLDFSSTVGGSINGNYIGGFDIQAKTHQIQVANGLVLKSVTGSFDIGTSIGNILGSTNANGISASCATAGATVTIQKNSIGINPSQDFILNLSTHAISVAGNCDMLVGGDDPITRNYFNGYQSGGARAGVSITPDHVNQNIVVKNNFFGAKTNGESFGVYDIGVFITNESFDAYTGQVLIERNLFLNAGSYGVRSRGKHRTLIIRENTFELAGAGAIRFLHSSTSPVNTWFQNSYVLNNHIGATESDPYFGQEIAGDFNGGQGRYGIWMNGAAPTIYGNVINADFHAPIYADHNSNPTIGGTDTLSGSLCEGLEKNCITGGDWSEIYMVDSVPKNEATIFDDNTFTEVKEGSSAVEISWYGLFEMFSGDKRRTDLANGSISIPVPDDMLIKTTGNSEVQLDQVTNLTNYNLTCTVALNCPVSDGTTGVTSVLGNAASVFSNEFTWLRVTEYVIDKNGNKTEYSTNSNPTQFDEPHLSSREFSFDGNSTTHIPSSDRGQPWTTNLSGDRNINTGNFGRFQIMEVEYVDANPILQEDGSYVITVDSTEDIGLGAVNVQAFADDGTGTASGGMSKLSSTVLANGKTSLREATTVAAMRNGYDKVHFNIPTTDSNWNTAEFPGAFKILPAGRIYIGASDLIIDGTTQQDFTGDTRVANLQDYDNATVGPEIIFDYTGYTGPNYPFVLNGDDITVRGLGFYNNPVSKRRPIEIRKESGNVTSHNIVIEGNDFVNNLEGGMRSLNDGGLEYFTLRGNVFRSTAIVGAGFGGAELYVQRDVTIENNYFVGNGGDGLSFENSAGTVPENITIKNNIFYKNGLTNTAKNGIYFSEMPDNSSINIFDNRFDSQPRGIGIFSTGTGIKMFRNILTNNTLSHIDLGLLAVDDLTPNDEGDSDTGPNNLMNYPEVHRVTYLSGGKYKVEGILDNNVSGEGPFDIEICLSDNHSSGHGGCTQSLGYFENVVNQVSGGLNPWSVEVTVSGDNGTQDHIFTSLATNALGSTSEFSENFNTATNPNFSLATYPITLVSPLNNEEVTDPSPILNWNDSGDLDLKHYEIYLNGSFYALVLANQSDLDIPAALPAGTYSWQVVGVRKDNTESGRSDTRTFIVPGETLVSFPVVEPITPLPPVSFIPREDEIPVDGISSITPNTILTVTLGVIGIAVSAGGIVFIKRRWF